MFATVIRVQLQPGTMERGRQFWQQTMLPVLKQQQGFRGLAILGNDQSNIGMAVLVWDSEAAAEAGVKSQQVQDASAAGFDMLVGSPEMEGYEVALLEWD